MSNKDRFIAWITAMGVAFTVGYLLADSQRPAIKVNITQTTPTGDTQ